MPLQVGLRGKYPSQPQQQVGLRGKYPSQPQQQVGKYPSPFVATQNRAEAKFAPTAFAPSQAVKSNLRSNVKQGFSGLAKYGEKLNRTVSDILLDTLASFGSTAYGLGGGRVYETLSGKQPPNVPLPGGRQITGRIPQSPGEGMRDVFNTASLLALVAIPGILGAKSAGKAGIKSAAGKFPALGKYLQTQKAGLPGSVGKLIPRSVPSSIRQNVYQQMMRGTLPGI